MVRGLFMRRRIRDRGFSRWSRRNGPNWFLTLYELHQKIRDTSRRHTMWLLRRSKTVLPRQSTRVRSRQCQGFPRNPGRFHPGSGL